jgi:hypothetical protein
LPPSGLDDALFATFLEKKQAQDIANYYRANKYSAEAVAQYSIDLIKTEIDKDKLESKTLSGAVIIPGYTKSEFNDQLLVIQKEYITKSNAALITAIAQAEDVKPSDLKSIGISLNSLKPPTLAKQDYLPLKTRLQEDEKAFITELRDVIVSNSKPTEGKPKFVTSHNLAVFTSLHQQYHAHKAVNDIINALHTTLPAAEKKAGESVVPILNSTTFDSLKDAKIITELAFQFKSDRKGDFKEIKGSDEHLKEQLHLFIKNKEKLETGKPPLNTSPPITDATLITALESSRKKYREAFLREKITKIDTLVSNINPTIILLTDGKSIIEESKFDEAIAAIKKSEAELSAIRLEINNSGLDAKTVVPALEKQIQNLEKERQRFDTIIKSAAKANDEAKAMLNVAAIPTDLKNIIINPKTPRSPDDFNKAKLALEAALAQLPKINDMLNATRYDKIRVKETREQLKQCKDDIEKLQKDWEANFSHTPLHVSKTVEVVSFLRSRPPKDCLKAPAGSHHAIKQLYAIYNLNWGMAYYAKTLAGHHEGKPNEYLSALQKIAIDQDAKTHTTQLQRHIEGIKNRLNNLTYGENKLDAKGATTPTDPANPQYVAKNPKDKAEVDFLVQMMLNFASLQDEMKEIHNEKETLLNKKPTHTLSAFGVTPESFSNDKKFQERVQEVTGRPIEIPVSKGTGLAGSKASDEKYHYSKESLPNESKKDYDRWMLYVPPIMEDAKGIEIPSKIPVIYTHESRTNGIKSIEDGILSIDPNLSDRVLLAKLLVENTDVQDLKNPAKLLSTSEKEKYWLDILKDVPQCIIDDRAKLRSIIDDIFKDPNSPVKFTRKLDFTLYPTDRTTDKIIELIDKERYDQNRLGQIGLPKSEFLQMAKRYLDVKCQQIKEGRCPTPIELFSNSKPLMQAWQCVLELLSPDMRQKFIIDPQSKKFNATSRQKELIVKSKDTAIPYSKLASRAEEEIKKDAVPSKKSYWGLGK